MTDIQRATNRRSVLLGMGAVAAASGLAACGGGDSGTATSGAGSSSSTGAGTTGATGSSTVASSSSAGGSGAGIPTSKVPVGSGFIDAADKVIISQPTAGQFKAFSYICTHQGCPITRIDGDAAVCPCHGSAFSLADGSVTNGPAEKPLTEKKVTVNGSSLTVS